MVIGLKISSKIKMQRPISRGDRPSARGGLQLASPEFRILTILAQTPLESGLQGLNLELILGDFDPPWLGPIAPRNCPLRLHV